MRQKLLVLFIIPVFAMGMIPITQITLAQQSTSSTDLINGLLTPRIDGLIDKTSSLTSLTEWGDAKFVDADFLLDQNSAASLDQEEEEPIQMRLFSKWVGNDFYFSFDFPKTSLTSVQVQFDVNQDGKLSDGDVRLIGTNLASQQNLGLDFTLIPYSFGIENKIEIYKSNSWWDPTELNSKAWNTADWDQGDPKWNPTTSGFTEYADRISNIGKIAISQSGGGFNQLIGPMFDVELRFSPSSYRNFLSITDSSLADSAGSAKNTEISYATLITTNTGSAYGYPGRPSSDDKAGTFSMTQYMRDEFYFDIPTAFSQNVGLDHLELTQTVQTENNDLSLVRNKQSLARVFIDNPQTVSVDVEITLTAYAFAIITIIELGSLTQTFSAPVSPDRKILTDSANFEVPDDWTAVPWLILKAKVSPVGFIDSISSDNTVTEAFELKETHNMNIYYIRVNTGTSSVVNQVSQTTADSITSAFAASYPIANPNFVQLDWNVLGADSDGWSDSGDLKTALTDIVTRLILSILFQILFGVENPLPIPDQIFGMVPSGGGSSTPGWAGYETSFASWGAPTASSGSLVMAHEINHNIGDNNTGRHVGNFDQTTWNTAAGPSPDRDFNWGCGASGPDVNWPGTNDNLNQIYTDTLGWNPGTGLIQNTKDDLMSYCNAGTPRKWISDYRWEFLFDRLKSFVPGSPTPSPTVLSLMGITMPTKSVDNITPNFTLPQTRVISGTVYEDGSGTFNPSYRDLGVATKLPKLTANDNPDWYLDVIFSNATTNSYGFNTYFGGAYEVEHPFEVSQPFTFWIPDVGEVVKIELYDKNRKLLDVKSGSGFGLSSLDFTAPSFIKRGEKVTVSWNYNGLSNATTINAQLQYSPDNGHWYNIGTQTTGTSISDFTINELPGGSEGKFKVVLNDGFDTAIYINLANTSLTLLPPQVRISRNNNFVGDSATSIELDQFLADPRPSPIGSIVSFKATAYDPQKGDMNLFNLIWTVSEVSETGLVLSQSTGRQIDTFRQRFDKPGLYRVQVSATSDDQVTGSDSIIIRIISGAKVDVEVFKKFIEEVITFNEDPTTDPNDKPTSTSEGFALPMTNLVLLAPFVFSGILTKLNRKKMK